MGFAFFRSDDVPSLEHVLRCHMKLVQFKNYPKRRMRVIMLGFKYKEELLAEDEEDEGEEEDIEARLAKLEAKLEEQEKTKEEAEPEKKKKDPMSQFKVSD